MSTRSPTLLAGIHVADRGRIGVQVAEPASLAAVGTSVEGVKLYAIGPERTSFATVTVLVEGTVTRGCRPAKRQHARKIGLAGIAFSLPDE